MVVCPSFVERSHRSRVGHSIEVDSYMKMFVASLLTVMGIVLVLSDNEAAEKAKYTIKEVMKKANGKNGLLTKVTSGKASAEDKQKLAELYKSLALSTPPKGDAEDWKMRTVALVKAADLAATGDANAAKALKRLSNCMGCHKLHKK